MRGLRGVGIQGLANPVFSAGCPGGAVPWYLSGGVTCCIAAYQAVGAASLAASYVNLANPGTYDLSGGVDPTWDTAIGWTFNGANQYKDTDIVPAVGACQTWTMILKFSGASAAGVGNRLAIGSNNGSGGMFALAPINSTGVVHRYYSGTNMNQPAPGLSSGIMCIAGGTCYLNGAADGTLTPTSITYGEIRVGGTTFDKYTGNIEAVAIYDCVLTLAQVEAVTAAMGFFEVAPLYSFVVFPDLQFLTQDYPASLLTIANWVVANTSKYHILGAFSEGDLMDDQDETQRSNIHAMYDILDAANLPYVHCLGGIHDDPETDRSGTWAYWNETWPLTRFTSKSWWNGGVYAAGNSANMYWIWNDYLFLFLEFGPRQVIVDWANTIAAANPTKQIIVITHETEYNTSPGRFSTTGDNANPHDTFASDTHDGLELWNEFGRLNSNIILWFSGHHLSDATNNLEHHTATGDASNTVESIFSNYQGQGNNGTIELVSFYSSTLARVRSYSPVLNTWLQDGKHDFYITLP